jgi:uncharacterized protein
MAKIDSLGNSSFLKNRRSRQKDKESQKTSAVSRPFLEIITSHDIEGPGATGVAVPLSTDKDLEVLLDDVHSYGERLKERPTMERIREYREAVASFLQYIVHFTFEAETIEGSRFNPMKKQKRYTLVRLVNEKLEKLATGVLANQISQLDILRRVEEINGLLVDLLH